MSQNSPSVSPIAKIKHAIFTVNNSITKINTAKFAVFGPINRENLFPRKCLPLRYQLANLKKNMNFYETVDKSAFSDARFIKATCF